MTLSRIRAAALAALVFCAAGSQAQAVPVVVWYNSYVCASTNCNTSTSTDLHPFTGGTATYAATDVSGTSQVTATAVVTPTASPTISVHAESNAAVGYVTGPEASADLNFYYYMEVIGAPGQVNVIMNASGSAPVASLDPKVTLDFRRVGGVPYYDVQSVAGLTSICGPDHTCPPYSPTEIASDTFNVSPTLTLDANTVYQIEMRVEVHTYHPGSIDASIDPNFEFAPGVTGYSFVFSDGVGNGRLAETPLPAALPLFISGLGGLGLLGWRRKQRKRAFAA